MYEQDTEIIRPDAVRLEPNGRFIPLDPETAFEETWQEAAEQPLSARVLAISYLAGAAAVTAVSEISDKNASLGESVRSGIVFAIIFAAGDTLIRRRRARRQRAQEDI